jgi:sialic acid synthase SpsE
LGENKGEQVFNKMTELLKYKINEAEGEDHEVSMGQNTLDNIIKNAQELKQKLGNSEKNVPAWIQDHISVASNNIEQANTNYHEY